MMRVMVRPSDVGFRIDGIQLAGFDERSDDRPVFGAAVGAGEEGVLPDEGYGTDRAFDRVGVDLDHAVVDEPGQPFLARQRIASASFPF
jgi:hypothetical protein